MRRDPTVFWALSACLLAAPPAFSQELSSAEKVTLEQAIRRAQDHNPSSRTAVEQVRLAYAQMEETRSASLPALSAAAGDTLIDHDRVLTGKVILPMNTLTAALTLSAPLVTARAWANWKRAADLVDVARLSVPDTRRLVAVATARAYLTIYTLRLTVDVNLQARDNARAHLQFAQKRLSGGVGNRIDATRAAQELATDEANLQRSYAQLAKARESLGILMGMDQAMDIIPSSAQLPAPPPLEKALKDARELRTDVKVSERRVAAADASLGLSYTEYLPTLGFLAQGYVNSYVGITTPSQGWQLQLLLSLPLYDGGLRYGLTHEREATLNTARLSLEQTVRQVTSDVRAGYETVQRADASLRAAKDAARLAGEALKLADLAYRAGTTTDLDLVDAQRQARDAATAAAVAEDNDLEARLDVLDASGSLSASFP